MASAALELVVTLQDRASGVLDRLGGSLGTLGKVAGGFALGGIAAVGGGFIAAAAKGLSFNNSMEQVTAQLNAFTKDGAKSAEILEMIKDRASKTPFAFEEMATATAGLLPAAKASGVALEDLVGQAEILAASNPAEGLEGAAFALREATGGDFQSAIERFNLPRQYINQLKEEGVPNLEILRRAMLEMGYDSSLVSNMAETMSGRWSTFLDTLTGVAATASKPIFDLLSGGLGQVNGLLETNAPALEAFGQAIASGLTAAIQTAGAAIGPMLAQFAILREFLGYAISDFTEIGPLSSEFGESLGFLAEQLGLPLPLVDLLEDGIFAVQGVLQSLMTTFTDAATPTEGLIEVLSRVSPMFNLIRTVVETALPVVQQIVEQVFGIIGTFMEQNGADIVATVTQAWGIIQEIVKTATTLISGIVLALTIVVRDLLAEHGDTIARILGDAWTIVKNVIMGALEIIQGLLKAALAIFQGDWQGAWEAIRTMSEGVVKRIWEIIKAAFDMYLSTFGTSLSELKGKWDSAWASLQAAVAPVAGWIDGISNAISGAIGWIGRMADKLSSIHVPDWLQGHSPPPMAKWFDYIADSAQAVTTSMPNFAAAGVGAGSSTTTSSTINIGAVNTYAAPGQNPQQVTTATLRELNRRVNLRRT